MKELIGQTLDRYKIIHLLSEGGMGAVFQAYDITLQRDVAIKVMQARFAQQSDFKERFLQEARSVARLDHPGIVKVFDFGQSDGHLYIVMELLRGDNLAHILKELREAGQWIILPEAVGLVKLLAQAVDYSHRQGVYHRDIKPANIMLKPEPADGMPYRPVLTDLGLAKLAEGGMDTQVGSSMGTPAYMSPEQALGQSIDARSDVYSLGVLLYELATSRQPFPAKTISEAIRYHTREPLPPPQSVRADIPEPLAQVISKALEKDPDLRFPDAAAMAKALAAIAPSVSMELSPPEIAGDSVSLITQYETSVSRQPEAELPRTEVDLPEEQPRIQVMTQDRTTYQVAFTGGSMSVGRDPANDISLDDPRVSRRHVRIEKEGGKFFIIDLDSSNGTFIGDNRLMPGVRQEWLPGTSLRMGNHWLRLILESEATQVHAPEEAAPEFGGVEVDPSRIYTSGGQGLVGVFLENTRLMVEPGGRLLLPLLLYNRGRNPDTFRISIEGLPSSWIQIQPRSVQVQPGKRAEVGLTIQPPRSPSNRAGRYPFTLRVASSNIPSQVADVRGTLTLGAYYQFRSDLHPERLAVGQIAQVTVHNQGNTQEVFNISVSDPNAELTFEPPQAQLQVPEGQSASADITARANRFRLTGGELEHPYSVRVTSSAGQTQTHSGEYVSMPAMPVWVLPLLVIVCLCLVGSTWLIYSNNYSPSARARATANAERTFIAAIVEGTGTAEAATAAAQLSAGEATAQAVTATAAWFSMDTDQDGLSNERELELGTAPDRPDTDGDSVGDGDEINRGTDPLKPDTDGDGLNDGEEIVRNSDPRNPDTDGDGIPDGLDQAPLQTSTATNDLSATQGIYATQTAAVQAAFATQTAIVGQVFATQTASAQQTLSAGTSSLQQTQAVQTAIAQQVYGTQTAIAATAYAAATQTAIAGVGGTAAAQTATAQAAINATAAAAAATQTAAAALTATAQAGGAAATAAAGTAMAATQTAQAGIQAVYIYQSNTDLANAYKALLDASGLPTTLIPQAQILSTNFSPFKVILIGSDTVKNSTYPWGDAAGAQVLELQRTGLPVLGLGEGGGWYFDALDLQIDYTRSTFVTPGGTQVEAADPSLPVWTTPTPVPVPGDFVVTLYNIPSPFLAVGSTDSIPNVERIGRQVGDATHYPIIAQGDRYMLWGYNLGPNDMTAAGKSALVNAVYDQATP